MATSGKLLYRKQLDTSDTDTVQRALDAARTAAGNLQKNLGADLSTYNPTQVNAAGSAESLDTPNAGSSTGSKKRRNGGSLSSQLGINV